MKAKFQFRLPGVVRCTTSIYRSSKQQLTVKLIDYRDRLAPRIAFKGTPLPDGSASFFAAETGDAFTIGRDWKGGVFTCGRTGEVLLFGLTQLEDWSKPVPPLGNFYKVLTGRRMVVVRARDRAVAMMWAAANVDPAAYVGPASWTDVELFRGEGGDIETVTGPS